MLELSIKGVDLYDELKEEFIYIPPTKLRLEHSLVSISKWEEKWEKVFLSKDPMSHEETIDYVRCMTITQNVDPMVYEYLTDDHIRQVMQYIEKKASATWFSDTPKSQGKKQVITSELVYYWMFSYKIPKECEKWHFNRLMILIQIFSIENAPKKKMSRNEILSRNKALNDARLKAMGTTG